MVVEDIISKDLEIVKNFQRFQVSHRKDQVSLSLQWLHLKDPDHLQLKMLEIKLLVVELYRMKITGIRL
jgi:hypothetical protein